MRHYVYVFIDPRNDIIRYVGKGKGNRCNWWKHDRSDSQYGVHPWLRRLEALGLEPIAAKIVTGLTDEEACDWERLTIKLIGRICEGGPLLNLSAGGLGGSTHSPETKRRMSAMMKAVRKQALTDPDTWAKYEAAMAASKAAMADPTVRAKHKAAVQAALADPAVRAKHKAARRAAWGNPAVRAKHKAAMQAAMANPTVRAKCKATWGDPAIRAKREAAMADPAVRAKHKAAMQAAMANPTVRAKCKAAWADPAVRAKHKAAWADPAVRAKHKAAMQAALALRWFRHPKYWARFAEALPKEARVNWDALAE